MLTYLVSKLHIEIQLKEAELKLTNYFSQNFNASQCEDVVQTSFMQLGIVSIIMKRSNNYE